MRINPKDYITVQDAAKKYHVSESNLSKLCKRRKIIREKSYGKRWFILESSLIKYLNK